MRWEQARIVATVFAGLGLLPLAGCRAPEPSSDGERPRAMAEGARGFEAGASPADSLDDAAALDALARRLAGLGDGEPPWRRHAELMDELWAKMERRHLGPIRAWRASDLAPLVPEPGLPLFYPFGGPDFLGSHLFFPEAPLHVLVGLQPPGRLPRLDEAGAAELEGELERLRKGFASLVEAGYFQQTDMDRDLDSDKLDGVLPLVYIFLARTGHRPLAVRHVTLDETGSLGLPGPDEEATAVEIDYERAADGDRGKVVYFSQDLSDEGLEAHPELLLYLERLGSWNTLMKAAVYLLQMEGFKTLRDLLLARTRTLVQDDSGLAHRDLAAGGWELSYFGAYSTTLPVYREYFQEDLKAAFADEARASPLPFAIGYHSQIGEGCLIVAGRRTER